MDLVKFLKDWTLPVAIVVGSTGYLAFAYTPALDHAGDVLDGVFGVLFPFSVFFTLFFTFTGVDYHKMRPVGWQLWLVLCQLSLMAAVTAVVVAVGDSPRHKILWESVLTCVIAPCASAAPVVVGKLDGDTGRATFYTLASNLLCALTIPAVFPLLEKASHLSFAAASLCILQRLALVLLLPLLLGCFVHHCVRPLYVAITKRRNLSFYSWAVSLAITTGITVKNICHSSADVQLLAAIAAISLAACLLQFAIGRTIGRCVGDPVTAGQGMFQKNTAMAILMAYQYLNPVASVGAGCYVLWQNLINSYELYLHRKRV